MTKTLRYGLCAVLALLGAASMWVLASPGNLWSNVWVLLPVSGFAAVLWPAAKPFERITAAIVVPLLAIFFLIAASALLFVWAIRHRFF
ncbi:hypothetical protein BH10PSE17_BH10PSE17_26790 [soil metagenome]